MKEESVFLGLKYTQETRTLTVRDGGGVSLSLSVLYSGSYLCEACFTAENTRVEHVLRQ